MNKEAIDLLIRQQPKLKSSRSKLEAMQPGYYCIHRSWGLGQIKDYDEKENKLIIDFEEYKTGHAMDPAFCVDKLEILQPDNIIVRHREDPELVGEILKKKPTDIIVDILGSSEKGAAPTSEIEKILQRLLGQDKYKKWWTATKKLLIKDPRIAVPGKKTEPYILRAEPVKAEEEILEEFFSIQAPKKQILLAEKLLALSITHEELKDHLHDILQTLTKGLQESKILNQGERLQGLWVRNDLARFIHEDVENLTPTSSSILEDVRDFSSLAAQIPPTYFKRFLDLIFRTYTERWEKITFDLLKSSSGKFTTECINFLIENGLEEDLDHILHRWLEEQIIKGPLLLWILKNRHSRKYTRMLSKLISPRLFNAIFYAIDYEALHSAGTRRIPLSDILSDDTELISELLSQATQETAQDLATTLLLNQGFEDLTKKSLLARFIRLFPNVQSLVSGPRDESEEIDKSELLIVSKESHEAYKKDYEILLTEKIPENKKAIALAREHGDLKENAEYKMARQDQDTLLARKAHLERDLTLASVSDFKDAPSDVVGVGNVVTLIEGSTGNSVTYSILGAWDSHPEENILSYKTPLGQSLISKKEGDVVKTVIDDTEELWTIQKISRWVDLQK